MPADQEQFQKIKSERTLVVIKPDGVLRKISGEIISRFERKGLKLVGMKMLKPTKELVEKHYTDSEEWLKSNGERTYNNYVEKGITPTMTPRELALRTRNKLVEYMSAGPVIAIVLEGAHAVEVVRRMRGATSPLKADVGSIGFDYTLDSYELSDAGDWATRNIIHASDKGDNDNEIKLWFSADELIDYVSPMDGLFYSKDWYNLEK